MCVCSWNGSPLDHQLAWQHTGLNTSVIEWIVLLIHFGQVMFRRGSVSWRSNKSVIPHSRVEDCRALLMWCVFAIREKHRLEIVMCNISSKKPNRFRPCFSALSTSCTRYQTVQVYDRSKKPLLDSDDVFVHHQSVRLVGFLADFVQVYWYCSYLNRIENRLSIRRNNASLFTHHVFDQATNSNGICTASKIGSWLDNDLYHPSPFAFERRAWGTNTDGRKCQVRVKYSSSLEQMALHLRATRNSGSDKQ